MLLEVPYHKDSLVVVTARSSSIFKLLGLEEDACFEMHDLEMGDAMNLFLHHAACGKEFLGDEEKHDIVTCISRCFFFKGHGKGYHYHPLALKVLGLQLGCHGEHPSLWVRNLPKVRNFNFFLGENPVFDILRSSFDLLPPRDQAMFMDVGCFHKTFSSFDRPELIEWLCVAHKQDKEQVALQLEHLKRKGLLQDVDLRNNKVSVHDLYLEFAQLEAKGSFNESANLKDRMWVYIKDSDTTELECRPKGGCWHKLIRLSIGKRLFDLENDDEFVDRIGSMEGMEWAHFSNVEVLQLSGLHWGHGALNLEGLVHLRIFELFGVSKIDRVEGWEKLKQLTYLTWHSALSNYGPSSHLVGRLPSSLKGICIWGGAVVLGTDLLVQCHKLCNLSLLGVSAHLLDLSNCQSLERVFLARIQNLQTLSGLTPCPPSNLHVRTVHDCEEIHNRFPLEEQEFILPAKDCFPPQLRELTWCVSQSCEKLNLSGFNELEVLDLSFSYGLTFLLDLGDLPALRYLNLQGCKHLLQLPDLSQSKNLRKLWLAGCSALELHEKDIEMLSELPLLHPVPISGKIRDYSITLDAARRKVLHHSAQFKEVWSNSWELWKAGEWEERDLGVLPIKIGMIGRRESDLVDNEDWNSD